MTKKIKRMMQAFAAEKESRKVKTNTIKTKMHQKKKFIDPGAKRRKRLFCGIFHLREGELP